MSNRLECPICLDDYDDFAHLPKYVEPCKHTFCYTCISEWITKSQSLDTCPMCRTKIETSQEIQTNLEILELFEKRKGNPECSCVDDRTHHCPTCVDQNYVNWRERIVDGQKNVCIGCAWNHADDTGHEVLSTRFSANIFELETQENMKNSTRQKTCGSTCTKISIAIIGTLFLAIGISAILFSYFV